MTQSSKNSLVQQLAAANATIELYVQLWQDAEAEVEELERSLAMWQAEAMWLVMVYKLRQPRWCN